MSNLTSQEFGTSQNMSADSMSSFVRSAAMQDAIRELEAAIGGTGGVLVCGEQGSGRELFARAIHNASERRHEGSVESLLRLSMHEKPKSRPFVVIDCANREALEERLFGYTPQAGRQLPTLSA